VYDLRISPFFSVNGRLRPCIFDLGRYGRGIGLSRFFLDDYFELLLVVNRKLDDSVRSSDLSQKHRVMTAGTDIYSE
jgi:hypothetical protein